MASRDHTEVIIRFAEGSPSNLSKCKNHQASWPKFLNKLREPLRDRVTTKQFQKLANSEQGRVKSAAGWFVGGHVEGGVRKRQNVPQRDLLTFDVDGCTLGVFLNLIEGWSPLCRYEWALYTTRKHTENAPRFRLVMPVAGTCPVGIYEPVMRILGAELDPTLDGIDDVSFRASQLMYYGTAGPDAEWTFFHNEGELVVPESALAGFEGNWRNFAELPYSEKRSKARRRVEGRGKTAVFPQGQTSGWAARCGASSASQ